MLTDNLYLCDPAKNKFCPKTNCHNPCYHTHDPECAWEPTLPVLLDPGAYLPERAHGTDAGLDLRTPVDAYVRAGGSTVIDTGVHIQLPPGTVGIEDSGTDGLDNLMPSCRMCNHYKRANSIETFRRYIAEIPRKLRENYIFKIGVVYGNVIEAEKPIRFYFETQERKEG